MGTLVVMRYPTNLVAQLADHTYVRLKPGDIVILADPSIVERALRDK